MDHRRLSQLLDAAQMGAATAAHCSPGGARGADLDRVSLARARELMKDASLLGSGAKDARVTGRRPRRDCFGTFKKK